MEKYNELKKATSTVKAEKQTNKAVFFENIEKNGIKVLFVGNSITLHGVAKNIGWNNFWGMAASSKERDYVHIVENYICGKDKNASFCVCNVAEWEQNYKSGNNFLYKYQSASDFSADIIIIKVSANTPVKEFDKILFSQRFKELIKFFDKCNKARILLIGEFYKHPSEEIIKKTAAEFNFSYCPLSDLSENEAMKAIGLFEHSGVANHPGDLGMRCIAERIIALLDL